jgi:hypothetical protein
MSGKHFGGLEAWELIWKRGLLKELDAWETTNPIFFFLAGRGFKDHKFEIQTAITHHPQNPTIPIYNSIIYDSPMATKKIAEQTKRTIKNFIYLSRKKGNSLDLKIQFLRLQ